MSFLRAAYKILKEEKKPLTSAEITEKAIARNLIYTKGRTPSATMGANLYLDIIKRGENSLFTKVERGKFGLREWVQLSETRFPHFRRNSFKDAAYKVLKFKNTPLKIQDITAIAIEKGLLKSSGRTPEASMGAQLYMDLKKLKNKSAFVQLGKNRFGLREWGIDVIKEEIGKEEKLKKLQPTDRKRSIVGDPINFEGLIYGPLNENGVIFLFSKIHEQLGMKIEAIQASFPDAKGRRKTSKGWEDIWIEFEYKSSQFKVHKHDPNECDIIICWEHDWKGCPLEVIELRKVIKEL
jgi:restriction system protein